MTERTQGEIEHDLDVAKAAADRGVPGWAAKADEFHQELVAAIERDAAIAEATAEPDEDAPTTRRQRRIGKKKKK